MDTGFTIGPHRFESPWILAPMAGVSEMPFRCLALKMGAAAAPTELVSAKGLLYGQDRTARYLTHDAKIERPFWVQIFGGEPESMAEGAEKAVALGADILDINMGCPVKKVTKNGAGSALLKDPKRAAAIVEAMTKRTGLPVTVKIRAGWDQDSINFMEVVRAVADSGAAAIAMHARTRAQAYSGYANWNLIRELVVASPIPVIGNGDAFTAKDAHRMRNETGCAAVMIGRGALGNPWIFERCLDPSKPIPLPTQRFDVVRRHLDAHMDFVQDERRGIHRFRQHLLWYAHGLHGARRFRERVTREESLSSVIALSEEFFCTAESTREGDDCREFDTRKALG